MARNTRPRAAEESSEEQSSIYPVKPANDATGMLTDKRGHMVQPPESYENIPLSESASPGQPAEAGHMHVPDDDISGEGWAPPTERGGGWEHPQEPVKEERLDQREGE
jgi:hypothetical protein